MVDIGDGMSHAVVARRHESKDSLDDFPTPPWATRALIRHIIGPYGVGQRPRDLDMLQVWEPSCNRGYMARTLAEYFKGVHTSDIHDYQSESVFRQDLVVDFLKSDKSPDLAPVPTSMHWIITNPPFKLAEQFIWRGMEMAPRQGMAFLVRTSFLEGVGRYKNIFNKIPPSLVCPFAERVPMFKGRLDKKGSTATAYCWLVWIKDWKGTSVAWIPPCRKQLEKDDDYG